MNRKHTYIPKQSAGLSYEQGRINALNHYRIAGTVSEEIFNHYVQMATLIFRIPAAMIAFIDSDAVYYKASIGIGGIKTVSRQGTTCAETIEAKKNIHVTNVANVGHLQTDTDNTSSTYKYYVGTPIVTPDGYAIGCLSLLDHKTHKLKTEQLTLLKILASAIMDAVEERLKTLIGAERSYHLLKTTREGMWEWDIYKDGIWWDSCFCAIFGYETASTAHYDLNFWCSRFADESSGNVKSAMQSLYFNGEYIFKKADNTNVHVLIRSIVIRDDAGNPLKIMGSIIDISERVKTEELTLKANMEMIRSKDEFISIASHEIKTPISIIKSYSQIIRRDAERDTDKKPNFILYADRIQKQNDKLLKLVENLLDVSLINNGKMNIFPETFDFVKLLDQILDELDTENSNHRIEKTGDLQLIVHADKFRIGQVLTNLITNAIKYSPGADKVIITYHKNMASNTAVVSVRDFGRGIAKEEQAKLFQKFYRIINLNDKQTPGTGLGLSIAMEIMKQHSFTITLDSELGKGSVFTFELALSALTF